MTQRRAGVTYTPRDATPESELSALTAAYRLILDFHANNSATGEPALTATTRRKDLRMHEPPCLLADVRQALSMRPFLTDYPERLAVLLKADEHEVVLVLETLKVEDEVLA